MILHMEIEIDDGGDRACKATLFDAKDELELAMDTVLENHFDRNGQPATWRHLGFHVSAGQVGA